MQAFKNCIVKDLNLSYDCLTGTAVRSKLRNLWDTDPIFWEELTLRDPEMLLPSENILQAEDEHDNTLNNVDDSDVPIGAVIKNIVTDVAPWGYGVGIRGGFEAEAAAERFEDKPIPEIIINGITADTAGKELGCGKRCKQPNWLYQWHCILVAQQWRHVRCRRFVVVATYLLVLDIVVQNLFNS